MKLHEAMKKALLEFGVSVLRERRFFYLLSDYHAFEDCPAMKDVITAVLRICVSFLRAQRLLGNDPFPLRSLRFL